MKTKYCIFVIMGLVWSNYQMKADVMTVSPFSFSSHNLNHHKMPSRIDYFKGEKVGNFIFVRDVITKGKRRKAVFTCPQCKIEFTTRISAVKRVKKTCKKCSKKNISSFLSDNKPSYKHGYSKSVLERVYFSMKSRCYNKTNKDYVHYGDRGIKVSDEFLNNKLVFYKYMESLDNYNEDGRSIDRINNDGDYERGNLRWATKKQQIKNRRLDYNHPTGIKYIFIIKKSGVFRVVFKGVHLGCYKTIESAKKALDEKQY